MVEADFERDMIDVSKPISISPIFKTRVAEREEREREREREDEKD